MSAVPPGATKEELALLQLIKENQPIPLTDRALTIHLRAKGWIEAIYLEPSGHELTYVGERVLTKGTLP